jgi:esterase/lipase
MIECRQRMYDVDEIGLKGFKKYSRYHLDSEGRPKSAVIGDSNGTEVEIIVTEATLSFDDRERTLDEPLNFLLETNAVPLIAYQVLMHPVTSKKRLFCLLVDSGETLPMTIEPSLDGFATSIGERYTLGRDGIIESVAYTSPDLTVRRAFRKAPKWHLPLGGRPFVYVAPTDIIVEDVEIAEAHYDAAATVARPKLIADTKAAAVFISGTGVYTRHGFTSRIDIGTHQLLDDLARNGIASVRYDKFDRRAPSVAAAESEQDFFSLCRDATKWLDWLNDEKWTQNIPKVLIGHSLEGLELAARRNVAAVILLATPGRSFRELTAEQNNWFQTHIGLSDRAKETAKKQRDQFISALETTSEWTEETVPAEILAYRSKQRLYKSLLDLDPEALVTKGSSPLLIVQGSSDTQVTKTDADRLAAAAERVNRKTEIILATSLDHHFKQNTARGMALLKKLADRRRRIPIQLIRNVATQIAHLIDA